MVSGKSLPASKSKPPSLFFFFSLRLFLQNRDDNTLPQKVERNKSIVSGSALQITVANTTVGERGAKLSTELATRAGRRVRGNRPEPGRGMNSGPASNRSAWTRLRAPPTSAGTQPCVSCVLTSGACPCPAAEETPRSAANAPAEKLR